jgi:hypothetical protein
MVPVRIFFITLESKRLTEKFVIKNNFSCKKVDLPAKACQTVGLVAYQKA